MGFRFRKSKNLGPFRVTVSKSGVSTSFGGKGARITKTASGKVRTTLSVPGTGISYVTESGGGKKQKAKEAKRTRAAEAKAERQAAFAEAARNPAPAEAGLYRLLGILTVVVGFALCFLFAPLGLVILACGIYVTVKARHKAPGGSAPGGPRAGAGGAVSRPRLLRLRRGAAVPNHPDG